MIIDKGFFSQGPSRRYVAEMNQGGISAPTASILENGFSSAPVWTRVSAGQYRITLAGAFVYGKTFANLNVLRHYNDVEWCGDIEPGPNSDYMNVYIYDNAGTPTDNWHAYLLIAVYF